MCIRFHPAFVAYLLILVVFSSWQTCLCTVLALFLHEGGHYMVSRLVGERLVRLDFTPFGGIMTYAPEKSPCKGFKGVCVAAAGPLCNYLALILLSFASAHGVYIEQSIVRSAVSANLAMLALNLLPVLPLDGGRIVFCLAYYLFPISRLVSILSAMGIAAGVGLTLLSLYGLITLKTFNCSLLIIGIYLIVCARRSRFAMIAENLYAVLQERQHDAKCIQSVRFYRVAGSIRIHDLIDPLARAECAAFIFDDHAGSHTISEQNICYLLYEMPFASIEQGFAFLQLNDAKKAARITN